MNYSRVGAGTVLIVALLIFAIGFTYVGLGSPGERAASGFWPMFFVFILEACVAYGIVRWIAAAPTKEAKVNKVLREFDRDELDLLRSRLVQEDRSVNDDYDSMAELMQSGKRKNEIR
jgi:hypothetical protein